MSKHLRILLLSMLVLTVGGCAGTGGGLGSSSKTNQLAPGMDPGDVKAILGEPSQSQFLGDKWIWKYSLHQYWKGFVPYYLVFSKENSKLTEWYADESEYQRQQQLWLQAMPATQRHEIELNVR